jgi:hypothetical protein
MSIRAAALARPPQSLMLNAGGVHEAVAGFAGGRLVARV